MMKKITTIFLLLLSMTATGQTIADLFRSMPSELLPGVSEANKTMLLVDSGKTSVPYALGEIGKIAQSNDFVHIRTSDAGDLQLKVLPLSSDSLIVSVIQTVCAGVCDSRIYFFTTNWEELDQELFLPQLSSEIFFNSSKKDSDNYKYAVSLPDVFPISARFGKTGTDLTLELHYRERLTDDQTEEITPFLVGDTLLVKWENGTFRLR